MIVALLTGSHTVGAAEGKWSDYRDVSWGSSYNSSDYFTISTPGQLAQFAYMINVDNKDFAGKTVTLDNNIDLRDHEWTPIGGPTGNTHHFSGTFDGNGHTIYGIDLTSENRVGLFSVVKDGTIKNLTLSNCTFKSTNGIAAGIVAYCYSTVDDSKKTVIENCHVTESVGITSNNSNAGGIAARIEVGNTFVKGCTSTATVHGKIAGGIIGQCGVEATGESNAAAVTVKDCLHYGGLVEATDYAGALVGVSYTATYCTVNYESNYYVSNVVSFKPIGNGGDVGDNTSSGAVRARVVTTQSDIDDMIGDMEEASPTYSGGITVYPYGVKLGNTYYSHLITLIDNADDTAYNTDIINTYKGMSFDVMLKGCKLYKDGNWNTICLPFSLSSFKGGIFNQNVKVTPQQTKQVCFIKELDDRKYKVKTGEDTYSDQYYYTGCEDGKLYMFFKEITGGMKAGCPYIVRWAKEDNYDPALPNTYTIEDPVIKNVTLSGNLPDDCKYTSRDGKLNFIGTYSVKTIGYNEPSMLYLGDNNKLYYPQGIYGSPVTIGAFHAYFQLNGVKMSDDSSGGGDDDDDDYVPDGPGGARVFVVDIENNEDTAVESVLSDVSSRSDNWYDLLGRRLNAQPTGKGVYIHKGKKLVK